jgi:membrane protein
VQRIFNSSSLGLIVFAGLLLLWELSRGVRTVNVALNVIHDTEDKRPWRRLLVTDFALAVALGTCLSLAMLELSVLPRLASGVWQLPVKLGAWVIAAALLTIAIGLLMRYAPAEQANVRWISAGSALVVVSWMAATGAFAWWAGSVADYKSATGTLLVFLVLSAYVLTSCVIFLAGVQLDEVARRGAKP